MVLMMSSAGIPAKDRFEWFTDIVASALAPTQISCEEPREFRAEASAVDLGPVQLSEFSYGPLRSRRTPALIRKSDPEQYQLALVTGSPMWISQRRNDSGLISGDMVLWDTSHPYEAGAPDSGDPVRAVILQIPKSVMPIRAEKIDRLLAHRIPGDTGVGAILAQLISTLRSNLTGCSEHERTRLGRIAVDLTSTCLARNLDSYDDLPVESRSASLMAEINDFIDANLSDTELTPKAIADHHNISLSRLHLLFQGEEESVAASIRRRRLERCRTDLTKAELLHHPVHAIAARWGFRSAPAFNRVFRKAYQMTPTELRHRKQ
ncbi:AraC family transcriptional regulator [Kitasatospora sp. NE20-6]|uniref:AraC family transcriptional regulator n=1 Tax=Kitasatospora sp. NE20-6 TaxID=2859066 RepID=UPI0034DBCD7B